MDSKFKNNVYQKHHEFLRDSVTDLQNKKQSLMNELLEWQRELSDEFCTKDEYEYAVTLVKRRIQLVDAQLMVFTSILKA